MLVGLFAGAALAVDTNLKETEKQFESEFKKLYGDKASEDAAAAALARCTPAAHMGIGLGSGSLDLGI